MIQTLDRKAMLAHLGISLWSARKYDRKASDEVTTAKQADSRAARVNKHLLGGPVKAHQAVISAAGKAREIHYRLTLPWGDTGWRLLPVTTYMQYESEMLRAMAEFDASVTEFVAEYPVLREQAKARMGDLFNETDYPATVADKFSIHSSFMPVPVSGDFRVELGETVVQQVQEQTRKDVERMCKGAMDDVWSRLREVVEKAADKLATPDAIFRDSLIGNIKATADLARKLNLDNDANLDWAAQQAEELTNLDPQILRDHQGIRNDVHQKLTALVEKMKGTW